jgi:cell fate regulator YaaT (PSP1 superfamily)
MKEIVGIQFKNASRVYYFSPLEYKFKVGEHAIVETVRGLELGKVIIANRNVEDDELSHELKPVIRKATAKDLENEERNNKLAPESFEKFKKYVRELNLEMKPLYCEYTVDCSKIIFYYCADERVDFRDLLKLLTPEFKLRVELRQIGPREGARVIGGLGTCGRELCCKKYLQNFDFVTMKMAKEQSMSLNNSKISGACGKLMCCIAYEAELYRELKKELPAIGNMVKTPSCPCCKVVAVDYLKKTVKTQENPDGAPTLHNACDVMLVNLAKTTETPEVIASSVQVNEEEIEITEEVLVDAELTEEEQVKLKEKQKKEKHYQKKKYRYGKKK